MKAVIMAGGEGSRLRPLTCDMPKPMAPVAGKPIIEYILDLLSVHNVNEAAVTLQYLPNMIRDHFPDNTYRDIRLSFSVEDKPLGTAGSVRLAAVGFEDDFIVISGDALTDFNLTAAVDFHKKSGAMATLIVKKVRDPREYGLVSFDGAGKITEFIEKPDYSQAIADTANTGIYIFSPEVLELIPDGVMYDFGKDLFPRMLKAGMALYAYEDGGYWCDIGDLSTYLGCQRDVLDGLVLAEIPVSSPAGADCTVIQPCRIGRNVTVGERAVIGPSAVIGDNCTVCAGTKIKNSLVSDNTYIGENVSLSGAIVCRGATVKQGASMFEGSVAGSNSVIGAGSAVGNGVKIWPGKTVHDNSVANKNLKCGSIRRDVFDDDGITGETGAEITPEYCARIGAAVGSLGIAGKVGIAANGSTAAQAFKMAAVSGLMSTGTQVWDFSGCYESMFNYAVSFCELPLGIFIDSGRLTGIRIVSAGGLPLERSAERDIESRLMRSEFKRAAFEEYRPIADMERITLLYRQELLTHAEGTLDGLYADVHSTDDAAGKQLKETLAALGCRAGNGLSLHLGRSGTQLSVFDDFSGYVNSERITVLLCLHEFIGGNDVAVPYDTPALLEDLAAGHGRKVLRILSCPANDADCEARKIAARQRFTRDGLVAAVKLLNIIKATGRSLSELLEDIPYFAVRTKSFEIDGDYREYLGRFDGEPIDGGDVSEGMRFRVNGGILSVKPSKRGNKLKLLAQAANEEIAEEIFAGLDFLKKRT